MREMCVKIIIILVSFITLTFGVKAAETRQAEIKIVTSFYPMYIMARNVARDVPGVSVSNLTPPITGCLHDYSLTAADMKKLSSANVFVANGAGMESFQERVMAQYPRMRVIQLSQGIPLIKEPGQEEGNPHVWVSISNAIIQVKTLSDALQQVDPVNAKLYRTNTDEYVAKLEALREKMRTALLPYKGTRIITFHEAFPYFAREYDLEVAAVVEREPGSEPSARDLAETVALIKKEGVKYLFSEPQYPDAAVRVIARETGLRVFLLDPAVTGPDDVDTYIKIMEKNLAVLQEAFSK